MKKLSLSFLRDPKFRYGAFSTALLCLCLAVLIALNGLFTALEKKNGWRVDYSFNSITTHSQSTLDVLAALPYPVHIYALYEKGSEDLQLFELLNRYSAASDLVTWEQAPLSLNPTFATRFQGLTEDTTLSDQSLVVYCAQKDRFRVLDAQDFLALSVDYESGTYQRADLTYESAITTAIDYVTREVIPVVWVAQGHNELNADESAALEKLLLDNHYDVRYTSLFQMTLQPNDLLVFLAPTRDLTDNELALVNTFTGQGGAVLFVCDFSDPIDKMPNYQALLRAYGVIPLDGVVVADKQENSTFFEGNRTVLKPQMEATETTLNLMLSGMDTLLMSSARAFQTPEETDGSLHVTAMLLSSEGAHLRSNKELRTSLDKQAGDPTGPFTLAIESYRFSETGDVSRAIAIGSTSTLTSDYYYSMSHGQEFIMRVMEYLLGSDAANLDIMSRSALRPALSADALTLGTALLVALPFAVLLAALIILVPRRHL